MIKETIFKYFKSLLSKPSGIAGFFSAMIMNISNRNLYNCVLNNINITPLDTVLEIGFGNGSLLRQVSQIECKKIYGIDISPDMISAAKSRNKNDILNNKMELKFGDIKKIPFIDSFFSITYTVNTIYFWGEINNSLLEIGRVLKNDGVFINTFFSKNRFNNSFSSQLQFKQYDIDYLKNEYHYCEFKIIDIIVHEKEAIICIIAQKIGE